MSKAMQGRLMVFTMIATIFIGCDWFSSDSKKDTMASGLLIPPGLLDSVQLVISIPDYVLGTYLNDTSLVVTKSMLKTLKDMDTDVVLSISARFPRYFKVVKRNPCCPCNAGGSTCCACSGGTKLMARAGTYTVTNTTKVTEDEIDIFTVVNAAVPVSITGPGATPATMTLN